MAEKEEKYTLEELQEKLTEKERIFCHEYIIDWNGARAARKAGYSEDSAKDIAYQNSTKLYIQQYIDFIKDDIAKEANISKLSLISELKKLAFSSIAKLHNTWITRKEFEELTEDEKSCIQEISTNVKKINVDGKETPIEVEYVKIKLHDKSKAIQDIMKAMGWNEPDKVDVTSGGEKLKQVYQIGDQKIEF